MSRDDCLSETKLLLLPAPRDSAKNKKDEKNKQKQTPWSESASELYRPSDRRLSAK
jgi:hypothetical protein